MKMRTGGLPCPASLDADCVPMTAPMIRSQAKTTPPMSRNK